MHEVTSTMRAYYGQGTRAHRASMLSTLGACLLFSSNALAQMPEAHTPEEPSAPPADSKTATTGSALTPTPQAPEQAKRSPTPETGATTPPNTPAPGPSVVPPPPPATGGEPTEADYYDETLGNAVRKPLFSEERTPPGTTGGGANSNAIQFALHGYFRAPLRLSWSRRSEDTPGQHKFNIRAPWLVDDDYYNSGFAYTPVNETDYAELYLMAGNRHVTATIGIMGSLYSDSAQPLINSQSGISQGYLTYRFFPTIKGAKARVFLKGGAFWDRFGYMQKYDTYIFGRTHQMGEQIRAELDVGKFTFSALHGLGTHLDNIQAGQGLSLLNYLRASVSYDRTLESAVYYLNTWTQDERQLLQITDASMRVVGVDARVSSPAVGQLYVAGSILDASQANFLSPTLEVMNSYGGQGITQNYLGAAATSQNGTGSAQQRRPSVRPEPFLLPSRHACRPGPSPSRPGAT